jgi:predicted NBD/HSP70 family sugar kinase
VARALRRNAVLDLIFARGRVSVPDLVAHLGIPQSTAVGVLGRLVERGLLARGETEPVGRGRPTVVFNLRLSRPIIACRIDGTLASSAIVGQDLTIHARDTRRLTRIESFAQTRTLLSEMLQCLLKSTDIRREELTNVALSFNSVPVGDGRAVSSSVLTWADERLADRLSEALGWPVAMCPAPAVIAEYRKLPTGSLPQSLVRFNVDDGVSAHAMTFGHVDRGANGLAGQIGHILSNPGEANHSAPLCGCGRRGCLEAYCSGPAICQRVLSDLAQPVGTVLRADMIADTSPRVAIEAIHQAWLDGDTYARAVMADVFERLASALGTVINLLDPDHVAVSGYVLENKPRWLEEIVWRCEPWVVYEGRRRIRIVPARAGIDDELRAIACEFFYQIYGNVPLPSGPRGRTTPNRRHVMDRAGDQV